MTSDVQVSDHTLQNPEKQAQGVNLTPYHLMKPKPSPMHFNPKPCRFKKKQQNGDALQAFPMFLGSDIGSDIGSDGWPGILQLKMKGADGVRSVYEMFHKLPGIDVVSAPQLCAYLGEERPTEAGGGYHFTKSHLSQLIQQQGAGVALGDRGMSRSPGDGWTGERALSTSPGMAVPMAASPAGDVLYRTPQV